MLQSIQLSSYCASLGIDGGLVQTRVADEEEEKRPPIRVAKGGTRRGATRRTGRRFHRMMLPKKSMDLGFEQNSLAGLHLFALKEKLRPPTHRQKAHQHKSTTPSTPPLFPSQYIICLIISLTQHLKIEATVFGSGTHPKTQPYKQHL
mmetsp:Transcript_6591/g.9634  ORF Transcript_6591/g.9634 Transcript_6591/m.9634 type:complete len:148 (-) Transcript_6591:27-470(-)